jgi:hypothetical protein
MALSTWALCIRRGSLDPLRASLSTKPRLGWKVRTGLHLYKHDEAREVVAAALARGFSVASHAIGNEAVARVLTLYEELGGSLGRTAAPRLEHATFVDRGLVARIRDLGLAVVVQPHFLALPAFANAPSVPGLPFAPARAFLDAGVLLAGSSDAPVAGFDPLDGIRSAVSRRTSGGHALGPDQRVTMDEAIAMYTRNGAKAAACFEECGSLEVGKRADLVLLDRPLRSEEDLASVSTRATVIGGVVRHGSLG